MINRERYLRALGLPTDPDGGQLLLLGEIAGALEGCSRVFLPFPTAPLEAALVRAGFGVSLGSAIPSSSSTEEAANAYVKQLVEAGKDLKCDGLYFGTPTIVEGKSLFPTSEPWTKEKERKVVQALCFWAGTVNYRVIVSGLGSGDISLEERCYDQDGGRRRGVQGTTMVAYKDFGEFRDWVLVRRLR